MIKKLSLIVMLLIFILSNLTGCLEQEAVKTENKFEGIEFESDIVELSYGKIDFISDQGNLMRVDVKYLFKNIANRDLRINFYVKFYDKLDNLIATSQRKEMNLPIGYEEVGVGPANIISYSGELVSKVDHVELIVEEGPIS
jgi:hypothetical protein